MLGIRDILVRIRSCGSIPLTNGSDSFLQWLKMQKKIFHIFFLQLTRRHFIFSLKKFFLLLKFCVQILFCNHYFGPLNTFMWKGKDPDPYLWLIEPDQGDPKTCGCGSPTLLLDKILYKAFCLAKRWNTSWRRVFAVWKQKPALDWYSGTGIPHIIIK